MYNLGINLNLTLILILTTNFKLDPKPQILP